MRPIRLRLSRAKGFNLQEASRAANGLAAVNVARPSTWGNPFKISPGFEEEGVKIPEITAESAVVCFRQWWERSLETRPEPTRAALDRLRGKNLACWCALDAPCHADVLLDVATRENAR